MNNMKTIKNLDKPSTLIERNKLFSFLGHTLILSYSKGKENGILCDSIGLQIDQPIQNKELEGRRKIDFSIQLVTDGRRTRLAWNKRIRILEKVM
ncbi:hypothetical protein DRF65_13785 [Chryseobacterium pennae]|uniref:Uncharacterized protein n=2 Tax=Chryseobacterium pennae TaxID=2258962 RepID=A0A3D9C7E9_9FLAO|nr:hypothetical protein DRF65_13785 [Chryseobacterium pennae]